MYQSSFLLYFKHILFYFLFLQRGIFPFSLVVTEGLGQLIIFIVDEAETGSSLGNQGLKTTKNKQI